MIPIAKNIKQIVDDRARINHILCCIERIEVSIKEQTFDSFLNNKILRLAISKWLEIIGEASIHITEEIKSKNTGIDWREMINLRNHILYEYFEIDYGIVWEAISDLKDLKTKLEAINLD